MLTLKIARVGDSVGLVLPQEALSKLGVQEGDVVYLSETPDGFRLTAPMSAARKIMKERRAALRDLAK
jgi:putative addiction module antidote